MNARASNPDFSRLPRKYMDLSFEIWDVVCSLANGKPPDIRKILSDLEKGTLVYAPEEEFLPQKVRQSSGEGSGPSP